MGAVYLDVAHGTVLEASVAQIVEGGWSAAERSAPAQASVAFQTLEPHIGPVQHTRIGRTMGLMAGAAAFHPHRCVFKGEGAALVPMAAEATGLIGRNFAQRVSAQLAPMRIVAIHALYAAFLQPVAEGLLELSQRGHMAGAAFLQWFLGFSGVNRMAVAAGNLIAGVSAADGTHPGGLVLMTCKADRIRLAGVYR